MNTRDRRPGYLPKVLALLLVLCVLVSAAANAPGWMRGQSHPQAVAAAMSTPQIIEPAVAPMAVLAMAEPLATNDVTGLVGYSDPISHGFDTAEAAELTLAALYERDATDWEVPVTADTTVNPAGGRVVRLAARDGTVGSGSHATPGGHASTGGSSAAPTDAAPATDSQDGKSSEGNGAVASPVPSQPETPAAGGSPPHETEPTAAAPTGPINGDAPSSEPPADDVATVPPIDRTPIDLLPIAPTAQEPVSVPEPSSLGLLLLGLAGIAGARRRRAAVQR